MQSIRKYWFEIFLAPFLITYFVPLRLPNNIAILWLGLGALLSVALERKVNLKAVLALLPIVLFWGWHFVGLIWTENATEGRYTIEMRSALAILPVIFMLQSRPGSLDKLFSWLATLLTIGAAGGLLLGLNRYLQTSEIQWIYNDNLVNYLGFQAIYYAHLVNFAIVFIVLRIWKLYQDGTGWKVGWVAWCLALIAVQFLLACRIPLIILFGSLVIGLLVSLVKAKQYKQLGLLAVAGVGLIGAMYLVAPKTFNRFQTMFETKFDFETEATLYHYNQEYQEGQWTGSNLRLAVWTSILNAETPMLQGVGTGDKLDVIVAQYQKDNFHFAFEHKTGPHNQYLEIYVSFGIIGIALILLVLAVGMKKNYDQRNLLGLFVVTAYAIGFVTEDILNRNQGIVMFALLYAFTMTTTLHSPRSNDLTHPKG